MTQRPGKVGLLLLVLACASAGPASGQPSLIIRGEAESQQAPHGKGNVYAPEILRRGGMLYMWFGAQARDGHDRIHLATSADGHSWKQHGVVLEDASANHCNDPAVVEVNGTLFMYYTRAGAGVSDEIAVASSVDGRTWAPRGIAVRRGEPGSWDAYAVGRPTVIFHEGRFQMWFDGRKDLPPGAPDPHAPKSDKSQRHVGYAVSQDGLHWEKRREPVLGHDAGGVHVLRVGSRFLMLIESRGGTSVAKSQDGARWEWLGLVVPRADDADERYGHVTPFLLPDVDAGGATLFYGAAAAASWDQNAIRACRLSDRQWHVLTGDPAPAEEAAPETQPNAVGRCP